MPTVQLRKNISHCMHCKSDDFTKIDQILLGYDNFRCRACKRKFNERTSTLFYRLEQRTDVVLLVVRWYLVAGAKLSFEILRPYRTSE